MKKQLLLGSALLAAIAAYPQNGRSRHGQAVKAVERINFSSVDPTPSSAATVANKDGAPVITAGTASSSVTWSKVGGSINIFGVLVATEKPLQYNDELNAVSFIHRKSPTYTAAPANNSGAILAEISTNWGASWDSTCVWSDGTNLARYPQGGIYNPPGNTNLSNAYVVVTGPNTSGSGWVGSYYASKQLGTGNYNNTASSAPNAMQFYPYATMTGSVPGHSFARYSFASTDDGKVRSLAMQTNDPDAAGTPPGDTAALLMTGSFNAGVINWSAKSFQPPLVKASDGTYQLYSEPIQAWNESGSIGYVVMIGALNTATASNRGWQPIVYKTTNNGASWALIPGIDFNSSAFAPVLNTIPIATQSNTNLVIPFFDITEGLDAAVDMNGKLHIMASLVGTYDLGNDSLAYTSSFTNWDQEKYNYLHAPGYRPYLFDFKGDGTGPWSYTLIDSMSSEAPSQVSTGNGFADNPWDIDATSGQKVTSSARYSMTRTPDGQFIVYTWAESDTAFTTNGHKWNSLPNIKARAARIGVSNGYTLSPTEINVTKPASNPNPAINGRAFFHYTSRNTSMPQCGVTTTINVPMTVSNNSNNPLTQGSANTHWYSTAKLDFSGIMCTIGLNEVAAEKMSALSLYPNPTQNSAILGVELKENASISADVYNMVGQLVKTVKAEGTIGSNSVNIDLTGVAAGVYMVKVNVNGVTTSAKLIKE